MAPKRGGAAGTRCTQTNSFVLRVYERLGWQVLASLGPSFLFASQAIGDIRGGQPESLDDDGDDDDGDDRHRRVVHHGNSAVGFPRARRRRPAGFALTCPLCGPAGPGFPFQQGKEPSTHFQETIYCY